METFDEIKVKVYIMQNKNHVKSGRITIGIYLVTTLNIQQLLLGHIRLQ